MFTEGACVECLQTGSSQPSLLYLIVVILIHDAG